MANLVGYCRTCGYNLNRLTERRCPECGTPFDPADPFSMVFHRSFLPRFLSRRVTFWTYLPAAVCIVGFLGVLVVRPNSIQSALAAMVALVVGLGTWYLVLARRRFRLFMQKRGAAREQLEQETKGEAG